MGVTMNHVAAVIAPLVGGLAWHYFGYRVIFFSGAVVALISFGVTQLMPKHISLETPQATGDPPPAPRPVVEGSIPD
jgi:MFS family permease